MLVEVTVLNPGPEPKQNDLPDRIPAALTVDNRSTSVMLERAIPSPKQTIQPGGFEQAKYLLRLPAESRVRGAMILSLTTRSEEHTSDLQSLMRISYAVFCLKKQTNKTKQQDKSRRFRSHKH